MNNITTSNITTAQIRVKSGQDFQVYLESKPQTGFMWELDEATLSPTGLVIFKGADHTSVDNVNCKQCFKFTSSGKKGETVATFNYKRSWAPNSLKVHNVIINVV